LKTSYKDHIPKPPKKIKPSPQRKPLIPLENINDKPTQPKTASINPTITCINGLSALEPNLISMI